MPGLLLLSGQLLAVSRDTMESKADHVPPSVHITSSCPVGLGACVLVPCFLQQGLATLRT